MKFPRAGVLAGIGLVLAGCTSLPSTSDARSENVIDRNGIDVVAADAGRQLVYFKDPGTKERLCHAPSPDFSRTAGAGVSLAVPTLEGGEVGVGKSVTKGAVDLGGREGVVLVARELLYRACELASNTNADPVTEREIYARFLAVIVEIARAHPDSGRPAAAAQAPGSSAAAIPVLPVGRQPSGAGRNPHDSDQADDARRR
jgi:hypothetical protein